MTKKILVIDDESDLLQVTMLRLKKMGYEVLGGRDGGEVLDLARRQMPDLIILDVYLPGIDGDEVAKLLKADKKLKKIPVILISATSASLEQRAAECGAVGFFSKPFDIADLLALIQQYAPL